ncbi:hypothetical protein OI25_7331 [Paraburkholderia fungorum]|uniref:HTH araC/xylS-type domain-containing protein n=1 Tax=Paraburkholderia fungorum TaxID=134537 RepID=A0AAU8SU14_9BURK|nr:hypothetical protein [Paraburkholderia fungorum]AJZ56984.1 hypothetical protein OI25_7331 [Paraburkholderia fungorum]
MLVSLCLSRPIRLRRLILPFDFASRLERGRQLFEVGGHAKRAENDGTVRIAAWTRFDYAVAPDECGSVSSFWSIDVSLMPFADADLRRRMRHDVPRTLAQQMFCKPGHAWNAEEVARQLGCTERKLRSLLFAQNESFTSILRRQRLMCILLKMFDEGSLTEHACRLGGVRDVKQLGREFALEFDGELNHVLEALAVRSITAARPRSGRCQLSDDGPSYLINILAS